MQNESEIANSLQSQLFEYNARFNLIVKENKKIEKKNLELMSQVKHCSEELNEIICQRQLLQDKLSKCTEERHIQELRNEELEKDIGDSKVSLKELQTIFRNVQEATEQLKKKHLGRDDEFQELLNSNRKLKGAVVDLEWKLRESENSLQLLFHGKEEQIIRLQEQVSESHDHIISIKEECVRLRQDKVRKEREVEEWKIKSNHRIEQLREQFDRRVEKYMDDALSVRLES